METKDLMLKYLDEAHAMEVGLVATLQAHIAMAPGGRHKTLLERHLRETQDQVQNIDTRRSSIGSSDGRGLVAAAAGVVRDAVGTGLSLTKGPIDAVRAQSSAERTLKNAKDECSTEALEIATYDALEAAARACGDTDTAKLAAEHRKTEERMLSDLRKLLPKLAEEALTDITGVKPQRSSSRSRSTSSRSTSTGRAKSTSSSRGTSRSSSTRKTAAKGGAKAASTAGKAAKSAGRTAAKASRTASKAGDKATTASRRSAAKASSGSGSARRSSGGSRAKAASGSRSSS